MSASLSMSLRSAASRKEKELATAIDPKLASSLQRSKSRSEKTALPRLDHRDGADDPVADDERRGDEGPGLEPGLVAVVGQGRIGPRLRDEDVLARPRHLSEYPFAELEAGVAKKGLDSVLDVLGRFSGSLKGGG